MGEGGGGDESDWKTMIAGAGCSDCNSFSL